MSKKRNPDRGKTISQSLLADIIAGGFIEKTKDDKYRATAKAKKLQLATLNVKHFERIEGLEIIRQK